MRSAAVVNAEIRALWAKSGSRLSAADEAKYQVLLVEWAAAVAAERAEDTEADEEAGAAEADEEAGAADAAPRAPRTGPVLRLTRAA
ncbi:hypothetical protein SAMN05444921_121172 [Streptomyces wuyuanensis]|uniref:Uncharacterized protein n=1 Tax=Streptomyces wuyuanensis TaxID=1196353 RepID=A0A1G9ZI18_9ACTN|nr:hypothetical protein SAMN05444921_121172 [Streptomyces wuyuanensis]